MVERVAEFRPSLSAFLQAGSLVSATIPHGSDGKLEIVIGFTEKERFSYFSMIDPHNRIIIENVIKELLSYSTVCEIVVIPGNDDYPSFHDQIESKLTKLYQKTLASRNDISHLFQERLPTSTNISNQAPEFSVFSSRQEGK